MSEHAPDSNSGEQLKTPEELEAEAMLAIIDRAAELLDYGWRQDLGVTVESGAAPLGPDGQGMSDLGMPFRFLQMGNFVPSDASSSTLNAATATAVMYHPKENKTVQLLLGMIGSEEYPTGSASDQATVGSVPEVGQEYADLTGSTDIGQRTSIPELLKRATLTIEATVFDGFIPPTDFSHFGHREFFGSYDIDDADDRRCGSLTVILTEGQNPRIITEVTGRDTDIVGGWHFLKEWTDPSKLEVLSPGDTLPKLTS
jgi:hypothetical protein